MIKPFIKKSISSLYFLQFLKRIRLGKHTRFSLYELLELYVVGILKGALTTRAGSISFSFFMALFPFLLFILNLIPFVPIANFDSSFYHFLDTLLPPGSHEFFHTIYEDIKSNRRGGLLSSSFLLSIILMGNGVNSIFGGFEDSYHVELSRNFLKQYLYSLAVGLLLAFLLMIAAAGFVFFQFYIINPISDMGTFTDSDVLTSVMKFAFIITISFVSSSSLYYFGTAEVNKIRFFSPGAFMTSLLFALTTVLFGFYIENFSTYNQLYGSIAALLILMLYIWLNSNILLLGFELNAVINRLKKRQ